MTRRCMSDAWIVRYEQDKRIKEKCAWNAIKKCRHDFATCHKHNHGCKDEESLPP